jgi:hypothetical protein
MLKLQECTSTLSGGNGQKPTGNQIEPWKRLMDQNPTLIAELTAKLAPSLSSMICDLPPGRNRRTGPCTQKMKRCRNHLPSGRTRCDLVGDRGHYGIGAVAFRLFLSAVVPEGIRPSIHRPRHTCAARGILSPELSHPRSQRHHLRRVARIPTMTIMMTTAGTLRPGHAAKRRSPMGEWGPNDRFR